MAAVLLPALQVTVIQAIPVLQEAHLVVEEAVAAGILGGGETSGANIVAIKCLYKYER